MSLIPQPNASETSSLAFAANQAWLENPEGERLACQSPCSLGRSATNDVCLPGEKVSRRHAVIDEHGPKGSWLTDLGSSNGTYLNGRRITQSTRLYDQDKISIGPYVLAFRHSNGRPRPRAEFTMTEVTVREIKTVNCWLLVIDLESSTRLAQTLPPEQIAVVTGQWLEICRQIVEQSGGSVNKYLGDGFLAYWHDGEAVPTAVAHAMKELKTLQEKSQPAFRIVLHHGPVTVGGAVTMGEESLMGQEVNFTFRMEKLAASLKLQRLASHLAEPLLKERLGLNPVGRHGLSGFDGDFLFYEF